MRILMVCLGNICRSPLAHGVLEHLAEREGIDWEIDSAGTGNWHVGECPDRRSIAVAAKYGVDISKQKARQFTQDDFTIYDYIFVMDRNNLKDVLALARSSEERAKVMLFLDNDIVPDPYFDGRLFEPVYKIIAERCESLLKSPLFQRR